MDERVEPAHDDRLRELERRDVLLRELALMLRNAVDAEQALGAALELLGRHLGVARVAYAIVDADGDRFIVTCDYADGCPSIVGQYHLSQFGVEFKTVVERAAGPLVVRDARAELPSEAAGMLELLGARAFVACPLVRRGSLRALFGAAESNARHWTATEISTVDEFHERLWSVMQQLAAEAKLSQSEFLLRIVGGAAKLGGWSIELPEFQVRWSEEVWAIHEAVGDLDPTLEDMLGYYEPSYRDALSTSILACVREGTSFDHEVELFTAKKRRTWVRCIGRAERDADGNICRIQGALQDVDERRKLEEELRQAQKMDAIGRLAGGIAHDFNNLLSVILGYAALLEQAAAEGTQLRSDVGEILRASERASELTRKLLAFSRRQVLKPRVIDINQVVRNLESMLSRLVGDDVTLSLQASNDVGQILADPGQLEQVIMNLVVNSRDAMPSGGSIQIETANVRIGALRAAGHPDASAGPHVMLAVSDNGVGMDAATRARVFEPFFTTKEPGKGTGLGLSTVWGIVTQSNGHIVVHSEPGRGTTFTIYFPCVQAAAAERPAPAPARSSLRGSETVLLVEDNEQVRGLARGVLRRSGYYVLEAQNGGEAFLIAEKHTGKIDLLLTDVVMPLMSGRELAERIGAMRPGIRVLYVSGYTEDTRVLDASAAAGKAFLPKPFTPDGLLAKLREVLESKPA